MYIIAVDLGGTKIEVGLLKTNGTIVRKIRYKTKKTKQKIIEQIINGIWWAIDGINKTKIIGIGLGVPGPADYKKGIFWNPPNLKCLWGVNLKKIIVRKFKLKTIMDNDGNCAALAEKRFGAGKKFKNIVIFTIGTGMGNGIIINNHLYHGRQNAGEAGSEIIRSDLKLGDPEHLATGFAILKMSRRLIHKSLKAGDLVKLARRGNKKAKLILESVSKYIGVELANMVHTLDPDIIILAGGVRDAGVYLLPKIKKELNKRARFKPCNVIWSKLNNPVLQGAAALLLEKSL